tara:strand:- start:4773 stop:5042 length:270 start_codon:yes stop_codon:yes gene_type:complete
MKIEKNKLFFGAVLVVLLVFIISYALIVINDDENDAKELQQTLVPELEQEQVAYTTKLDAINDLKEVRQTNAPSIYDEKRIDSMGFYDA